MPFTVSVAKIGGAGAEAVTAKFGALKVGREPAGVIVPSCMIKDLS